MRIVIDLTLMVPMPPRCEVTMGGVVSASYELPTIVPEVQFVGLSTDLDYRPLQLPELRASLEHCIKKHFAVIAQRSTLQSIIGAE